MYITRKEILSLQKKYGDLVGCDNYVNIMELFKGEKIPVTMTTLTRIVNDIGEYNAAFLNCVFLTQYHRLSPNGDCVKDCDNCWGQKDLDNIDTMNKILALIKRYVTERRA